MRRRRHHHRPRRLQKRLFMTFGMAIVAAMATSGVLFTIFHVSGGHRPWLRPLAFLAAGAVLWVFSGIAARRIAAPLAELARVATDLGAGKLERRVRVPSFAASSEIRDLASAFNGMAERIERQLRDQRELIGTVSHELRTPLARLRIILAMLEESRQSPELAAKLEREIGEMDALVGELLAGARVDAGALTKRRLDLPDLLRECLERAGMHDASLQVAPGASVVNGDATLISRAVTVLLDNAVKHGGKHVQVSAAPSGDQIAIQVEDDGEGLDAADLGRLFDPFVRGRGALPDERRGVGLGLYLVRRIAEAHGGQPFARNRDQGGARVGFTLARL
jgi:two-component system, OmpR family, sensor kinase